MRLLPPIIGADIIFELPPCNSPRAYTANVTLLRLTLVTGSSDTAVAVAARYRLAPPHAPSPRKPAPATNQAVPLMVTACHLSWWGSCRVPPARSLFRPQFHVLRLRRDFGPAPP